MLVSSIELFCIPMIIGRCRFVVDGFFSTSLYFMFYVRKCHINSSSDFLIGCALLSIISVHLEKRMKMMTIH
jgi:hypothetical protein